MRRNHFWKSVVAGVAALGLVGCNPGGGNKSGTSTGGAGKGGSDSDSFTIGIAAPLTGDSSEFGKQIQMGVELLAEELNAAGGIDGKKVKLSLQDDAGEAGQAQSVASTLAGDDSVVAVIGHFNSSCSLAGKPIYKEAELIMFTPASTNVEVTKDSDFVYRNIFSDDFQGKSIADYVSSAMQKKNVGVLFENDDYGTGLKTSFSARAKELGLTIVSEAAYTKEAPDYRAQLTTLQNAQPLADVILVAGLYTQAATIARQARDMGIQQPIIGGDGLFSSKLIELGGPAIEGALVTTPFLFDLGTDKAKAFSERFQAKYKAEPDAWAALSYDAMSMVVEGLKKNGINRKAVSDYLKTVNSVEAAYDGVSGDIFFDAEGDCKKAVQVASVKDGKFVAAEQQLKPDGSAISVAEMRGAAAAATTAQDVTTTAGL